MCLYIQPLNREKNEHKINKRNAIAFRLVNALKKDAGKVIVFLIGTSVGDIIADPVEDFDDMFRKNETIIIDRSFLVRATPLFQESNQLQSILRFARSVRKVNTKTSIKTHVRNARAVPAFVHTAGRLGGWTLAMILAGTATSAIDTHMKEENAIKQISMPKKTFDCKKNNYGCLANTC